MAEYHAKSTSSLTFDLTQANRPVAKLTYQSWFKFNALAEIADGHQFDIVPKGFWGTTVEVKEGDRVVLQFTMNWNGEIVMQTHFDSPEEGYVFRHRGLFRESFLLTDHAGTELLVMKPSLKWNLMSYEYGLTTSDGFESTSNRDLLLITSIHCANYYMSMIANMTGA